MKLKRNVNSFFIALAIASLNPAVMAKEINLKFSQGTVASIISSVLHPITEENRFLKNEYFKGVGTITRNFGISMLGAFSVQKTLAGEHDAPSFLMLSMANTKIKDDINVTYLNRWAHLREYRSDIWEQLRIRYFEWDSFGEIVLDTDKFYQIESYRVIQDKHDEFSAYLESAKKHVTSFNGTRVRNFSMPIDYETLGKERSPDYLVITEWDKEVDFNNYWGSSTLERFTYLAGYEAWLTRFNTSNGHR